MEKTKKIFFGFLLMISLLNFSLALPRDEELSIDFTYSSPENTSTYNINNTNYLQGYSVSTLWTYYSGLGNALWCELTGCIMQGDLNMNENNILNTGNITANTITATNMNVSSTGAYLYDGFQALKLAKGTDSVYSNTMVGYNAGNTTSYRQTAIGYRAGISNTGSYQTVIGNAAGMSNTGSSQTVVGYTAGYQNTGSSQTAIGMYAGYQNTGSSQTALGYYAGNQNTGSFQTAIGMYAGYKNSGNYTTGLGYYATRENTANNVVAIGYRAGYQNTVANQFIVKQANVNAVPLIQGDFATGNVGIGTTTPTSKLTVNGNASISGAIVLGAGQDSKISYDGTNLVFNTSIVGSGIGYFSDNVSATGYITRTEIYDKSQGSAMEKIKDASQLVTTKIDEKGKVIKEINHSAFYGYIKYNVTDKSKPVNITKDVEICDEESNETALICHNETITETTYPFKKVEEGVNIVKEIELLRQALYEQKIINTDLQRQINDLNLRISKLEK